MPDQPDRFPQIVGVLPIHAWSARLRGAGMSTPVAHYLASMVAIEDLITAQDLIEPGQEQAWTDAERDVCRTDDAHFYSEANGALVEARNAIKVRLHWHLDAMARRAIVEPAAASAGSPTDFEDMRFWINGKVPVPLAVGAAPPEGMNAHTLYATAKRTGFRQRELVKLWEGMCGEDGDSDVEPGRSL
jgi:hypothetical protein